MKVIELEAGRRSVEVLAGLVWHPLQGTGSARTREILAYAADSDADLKVVRGDEAPHVGLARKAEGAKAGQISAAAVIADALQGEGHHSVLVALRIPEEPACFLYIAVRDNVILADGDIVGTEQEVSDRLRGDKSFGGWDLVICPGEWGFADAQQRDFDAFFTPEVLKKPGSSQLQELRSMSRGWRWSQASWPRWRSGASTDGRRGRRSRRWRRPSPRRSACRRSRRPSTPGLERLLTRSR
jgi:hypothetical protein